MIRRVIEKYTGCEFAAKFLRVANDEQKEVLKSEMELLKQMDHKNILAFQDAYDTRNRLVLISERYPYKYYYEYEYEHMTLTGPGRVTGEVDLEGRPIHYALRAQHPYEYYYEYGVVDRPESVFSIDASTTFESMLRLVYPYMHYYASGYGPQGGARIETRVWEARPVKYSKRVRYPTSAPYSPSVDSDYISGSSSSTSSRTFVRASSLPPSPSAVTKWTPPSKPSYEYSIGQGSSGRGVTKWSPPKPHYDYNSGQGGALVRVDGGEVHTLDVQSMRCGTPAKRKGEVCLEYIRETFQGCYPAELNKRSIHTSLKESLITGNPYNKNYQYSIEQQRLKAIEPTTHVSPRVHIPRSVQGSVTTRPLAITSAHEYEHAKQSGRASRSSDYVEVVRTPITSKSLYSTRSDRTVRRGQSLDRVQVMVRTPPGRSSYTGQTGVVVDRHRTEKSRLGATGSSRVVLDTDIYRHDKKYTSYGRKKGY